MASEDIRNIRRLQWTYVKQEKSVEESGEGGLVVAIQSNGDIPNVEVQEVVVATDNYGVQTGDIQTESDRNAHSEVVPIAAMEEVQEDIPMVEIPEELLADIKNEGRRQFQKRRRFGAPFYHTMPMEQPPMDDYTDDEDYDPRYSDDGSRRSYTRRNRRPPKRREFAHRLQWRNKDMLEAMCSVEEKKMTIRGAAKKFSVPYSTLKDRIHGRVKHGTKPGVKTVLSPEEEEELVNYIRDMESAGFQVKHMDIRDRAGELLRLNHGLQSPYKDCSPGHNWLAGFIKRHPGLEFKRQNARNNAPSVTKQKLFLRKFFDVASQVFKKGKLYNRSDRVFALADVKIQLTVHGTYFPKATIFLCSAANGTVLPPFVVFRGHLKRLNEARETYPDAFFMCSYQGGSDPDIFHWWLRDFFLKRIPEGTFRPTALYMCRPVSDITLQVAQLAKEERVSLVALPSGTEHLLQSLDTEVCNTFKDTFMKRVEQWETENAGVPFSQKAFATVLQKVWRKCFNPEEIVQKFAANGLYPLNPSAISAERIIASASMAVRSEDEEGEQSPPPEAVNATGSDGEGPLSGLNLLSALSSHEFASLENTTDRYYAARTQAAEGDEKGRRITLTLQRRGPGRRPLREEQQEVEEEAEEIETPISSQMQRSRGYRATHEEILAHRLLQQQQAAMREKSRPSSALVDRLTTSSVRDEIAAARQNEEQITRAIDSILDREMVANTVEVSSGTEVGMYQDVSNRGFINITPNVVSSSGALGRPRRDFVVTRPQQQYQQIMTTSQSTSLTSDMISSGNAAGGPAKTVKIIKVKVEKGTDLQELAKELTRKIKEEREKQTQTKQKTLPSAASSLQVIKTIAFPGMISAETLNADTISDLKASHGVAYPGGARMTHGYAEGQVIEETVEEGGEEMVVEEQMQGDENIQEVVEEQIVEMDEEQQQLQQQMQYVDDNVEFASEAVSGEGLVVPNIDVSNLQPGQRVILEDGREYVVHLLQGTEEKGESENVA